MNLKKILKKVTILSSVILGCSLMTQVYAADGWSLYKQGVQKYNAGQYTLAAPLLEKAVASLTPQPAMYNMLAKVYEGMGSYQNASEYYRKQGELCLKRGGTFVNEGYAALRKADELESILEFYTLSTPAINYTLQKFEPKYGAYIGSFVGEDFFKSNRNDVYAAFEEKVGKQHAVYFDYVNVGQTMKEGFLGLDSAIQKGAALHVAYQPMQGLKAVTESQIRTFAQELKELGVPIFLRYAAEMNGDWVTWNGDPALYIQNWKMVTKIMREVAPNVAMVWSPSEMPLTNLESYYPGDDYVDWVGLSIYSKKYANGDITQPADDRNPLEAIDYVYQLYASKKPIMVSEYGASTSLQAGGIVHDSEDFAIQKFVNLYEGIRVKYPRVKCIQYFNSGINETNSNGRAFVNYDMVSSSATKLLARYKRVISNDYYLTKVGASASTSSVAFNGGKVTKDVTIQSYAKTYGGVNNVVYKLNGTRLAASYEYPYTITIPYTSLKTGKNTLEGVIFNNNGGVAYRKSITIEK
jgi:hypothetical protein